MNIDYDLLMRFVYGDSAGVDPEHSQSVRGRSASDAEEAVLVNFCELSSKLELFELSLFVSECFLQRLDLSGVLEARGAIHGYVCGGIKWAVCNCSRLIDQEPPLSSESVLDSFSRSIISCYGMPSESGRRDTFWDVMQGADSTEYTDSMSSGFLLMEIYDRLEPLIPPEVISKHWGHSSEDDDYFALWLALGFMLSYMAAGLGLQTVCSGECLWTRRFDGAWMLRIV